MWAVEGGPVGKVGAGLGRDGEVVVEGFAGGEVEAGVRAVVGGGSGEAGDLRAEGIHGGKGAEARGAPGGEVGEELFEKVESLEDGAAKVTAEVEDQFGFAGGFGEADKFLRGVLEVGLVGFFVAGDEVGDAEDGQVGVGGRIEVVACNRIPWVTNDRERVAWCACLRYRSCGGCA